ncbi:bile acid:sodium symporter family protein [uncultured Shewanella sp.]|uniref:bile acid:sodium symporter family protein n=1 Tax=uncultured Shewanella sp. TaxID=173975 RepID=UPI0026073C67|nr:bile acid:sodium symporter family protein [uncultured Shewanella sp.]
MEADILIQVILPAALFIIMLGMGLSLKLMDFQLIIAKPKAVILGVLAQMLMLPLIAYLIILSLHIEGALAVGLIILALCPGGTTSNLYTYLAKGDVALSVTLTSVVSLITPFTLPIILLMFMDLLLGSGNKVDLPVLKTMTQLLVITVIPISLGMIIHRLKPHFAMAAEGYVKIFSIVFLLLIVTGLVVKNISHMANYFVQMGLASLLLNVICMFLGLSLARAAKLNFAQQKSIAIEVGFQNGTLAIVIALSLLQNTQMAIAATCYSLLMFITGAIFTLILNRFEAHTQTS